MSGFIIHIGTPRTGTTVIQKFLLPKSKKYLVFQKKAYEMSGTTLDPQTPYVIGANPKDLINALETINPLQNPTTFFNLFIVTTAAYSCHDPTTNNNKKRFYPILEESIHKLWESSKKIRQSIVMSSEKLCETAASFACYSNHSKYDWTFNYIPICDAIREACQEQALISVCLREPISYLRSKYLRTFLQRRSMRGERDLSPTEYIQKQCTLESNHQGTSALTPAMHSEFIKQLQQHAFVKAFGFQELLASEDTFSLMGLQGEEKYAFRDFPRENKLPFTKEQEQSIEVEIKKALKQYGFYDRIMRAQMFE